jgi:diguanylate cyclase (GGDEF)-like protein
MNISVIESVITITQQRDICALEACLLDELVGISDNVEEAVLFRIEDDAGQWHCHDMCYRSSSSPTGHRQELDQQLLQQLQSSDNPILLTPLDKNQCLLVPIIHEKKTSTILKIIAKKIEPDLQYMVQALGRVYGNFIHLLIESGKDELTDLYNRKTFETRLKRLLLAQSRSVPLDDEIESERRKENEGKYAWMAMLDIDHFKKVNDDYGHVYGDEVLLIFSQQLKEVFRKKDLLFRFGGEEFVVVLEPISFADAQLALERFRKAIELYDFPQVGQVTVSIGFTKVTEKDFPLEALNLADKALYYAKQHGRNQVLNYEELLAQKKIKPINRSAGEIELF